MIWKTSEKKNETEIQNKMEDHSRRLEQAEDRISELEDEWKFKEKLKNSNNSRPMKGIWVKRPNLTIMGVEEGEKVQAKGIRNIFNKIITENVPNLEETMQIQVQETSRTPNRLD
jgi:hypothetical protein